jgi:NDP-sugar pyrophosphorylase family protein
VSKTIAILAGGLGTRVAALTGGSVPKAMLPVAGRPFIDHKLFEARRLGATRVLLLLGQGAEQLTAHLGDGTQYGVELLTVLDGPRLLGTGGAVRQAVAGLTGDIWITYGDTLLDVDLEAAEAAARARSCRAVMAVLHNRDQWQPSNASVADGRVVAYGRDESRRSEPELVSAALVHEYIDYGYTMLPTAVFDDVDAGAFDLSVIFRRLIAARDLAAFEVTERFHDIGTPAALADTDAWLQDLRNPTP